VVRFADLLDRYARRFGVAAGASAGVSSPGEPLGAVFRDLMGELDFANAVSKEFQDAKAKERAIGIVHELELAVDYYARGHEGATVQDYLEHVALFTMGDEDEDRKQAMVTLMTVHSAKGLEFPQVYVVNLADDLFPHHRALAEGAEEEERRLFYVALTRARQHLVLSMARQRKRFGDVIQQQPSRFVLEIEPTLFDGDAPHAGAAATPEQKVDRAKMARSRFFDELRKGKPPTQEDPPSLQGPAAPEDLTIEERPAPEEPLVAEVSVPESLPGSEQRFAESQPAQAVQIAEVQIADVQVAEAQIAEVQIAEGQITEMQATEPLPSDPASALSMPSEPDPKIDKAAGN
jgi:ATP-dependent exoDNAse (exonuclease V) beta subunit